MGVRRIDKNLEQEYVKIKILLHKFCIGFYFSNKKQIQQFDNFSKFHVFSFHRAGLITETY